MKKNIFNFFVLLSTLSLSSLTAQNSQITGTIDLDATIKEFSTGQNSNQTNYLFLEGLALGWAVDREKGTDIELVFVSAEWNDFTSITSYKALILFKGNPWNEVFPIGRQRSTHPLAVTPNERLMVLTRFQGLKEYEGVLIPHFQGYYIRKIR